MSYYIEMDLMNALTELVNTLKQKKYQDREMKRIFQWRRYLEWNDLSPQEKISFKRILFLPIFAYLILSFFNQNFLTIVILISGYLLYKNNEKGKLTK